MADKNMLERSQGNEQAPSPPIPPPRPSPAGHLAVGRKKKVELHAACRGDWICRVLNQCKVIMSTRAQFLHALAHLCALNREQGDAHERQKLGESTHAGTQSSETSVVRTGQQTVDAVDGSGQFARHTVGWQ